MRGSWEANPTKGVCRAENVWNLLDVSVLDISDGWRRAVSALGITIPAMKDGFGVKGEGRNMRRMRRASAHRRFGSHGRRGE